MVLRDELAVLRVLGTVDGVFGIRALRPRRRAFGRRKHVVPRPAGVAGARAVHAVILAVAVRAETYPARNPLVVLDEVLRVDRRFGARRGEVVRLLEPAAVERVRERLHVRAGEVADRVRAVPRPDEKPHRAHRLLGGRRGRRTGRPGEYPGGDRGEQTQDSFRHVSNSPARAGRPAQHAAAPGEPSSESSQRFCDTQGTMSVYEFGPFQLDVEQLLLTRGGEPVALGPKVVGTLLALVEHPNDVLAKGVLMDRIWPEGFVEEA